MSSNRTGVMCKKYKTETEKCYCLSPPWAGCQRWIFPLRASATVCSFAKKKAALSSIPLKCDTLYGVACWKANTAGVWHFHWNPAAAFGGESRHTALLFLVSEYMSGSLESSSSARLLGGGGGGENTRIHLAYTPAWNKKYRDVMNSVCICMLCRNMLNWMC